MDETSRYPHVINYQQLVNIAIQEALDGKVVEWMEKVSDEEYQASSGKE